MNICNSTFMCYSGRGLGCWNPEQMLCDRILLGADVSLRTIINMLQIVGNCFFGGGERIA